MVGRALRLLLWVIEGDAGALQVAAVTANAGDSEHGEGGRGGGFPPLRAGVAEDDWTGVKCLDVIAFNATTEPRAITFICEWLQRESGRGLRVGAVCAEVALRYDVSTETAKRWILKHSAPSGRLRAERGVLYLKKESEQHAQRPGLSRAAGAAHGL